MTNLSTPQIMQSIQNSTSLPSQMTQQSPKASYVTPELHLLQQQRKAAQQKEAQLRAQQHQHEHSRQNNYNTPSQVSISTYTLFFINC